MPNFFFNSFLGPFSEPFHPFGTSMSGIDDKLYVDSEFLGPGAQNSVFGLELGLGDFLCRTFLKICTWGYYVNMRKAKPGESSGSWAVPIRTH